MVFDLHNLKQKSLSQVKWVSFSRILPKLFAPITTVLMVNVFTPTDYGVVGICGAFISFLNLLQGFGIDDYIIRMKEETELKIYTTYWLNFSISMVLFLILTLSAPLIAHIYSEKSLIYFLPVLSINLLLNSLGFIPWAILRKRMEFKKLFFINFAPLLITLSLTLPLGYFKFGPWAIVIGQVTLTFLTNVYYLLQSNWKFKFMFDKGQLKEMFNFGKFVSFERIQEYLYANIDIFLIGYFLDLKTLGIYTLAKSWSWLIFGMVTSPMTEILYPAFQKFGGDIKRIRENFLEVEKRMFFITVPIFLIISMNAINLIHLIFPSKWAETAVVLSIIIIGDGIAKSFSLQRDIFKLIGKPDIYPKAFLINFFFTIFCYPIAAKFGLIVFAVTRVVNDLLYTGIQYYLSKREFKFSNKDFLSRLTPIMFSGLMMVMANLLLLKFLPVNLLLVIVTLIVVSASYIIAFYFFDTASFAKFYREGRVVFGFNK